MKGTVRAVGGLAGRTRRGGSRVRKFSNHLKILAKNLNTSVANSLHNTYVAHMDAREFKRWLKKQGCEFANHKGGSGHLTITREGKTSQLPMHGSGKELGTGLVEKIKKDLGL